MKTFNNINILFIPSKEQRYDTLGDYWINNKVLEIRITRLRPFIYSLLVLCHEIVEVILVLYRKIKIKSIDKWDITSKDIDPGANSKAPYYKEHMFALKIEKKVCEEVGIDWHIYDNNI